MLEALDLTRKLAKPEYKKRLLQAQHHLHRLQRACWEEKLATLVVFEGWDAAGKGTAINKLTQRLEPRAYTLHAIREPRTFERSLPWLWRFWVKLPNWGEIAIFDRSWYGRVLVERVEKLVPKRRWRKGHRDIVAFERALAADRYTIVKYFLHISKEEQRQRLEALESDPATAWHVEPEDWEHHAKYEEYSVAVEEMLERTETASGPWTLVEATDRYWARIKIFDTLTERMEESLELRGCPVPEPDSPPPDPDDDEEYESD